MDSGLFHSEYSEKLAEKYGYKDWMISRFLNFVPDTESLLEYVENNKSHNLEYIRANNLKIESQELKRRLIEKGYGVKDTILKEVFMVEKTKDETNSTEESRKNIGLPSVGSTLEYLKGYYYIQDLSSCMAVDELEVNENSCMTVLDMASSPGGKTTFMAQKMGNGGKIIACEPNPKRIPSLIFNLSRCNVKNTSIFNIFGEDIGKLAISFDRILLDAPCTLRRNNNKGRNKEKKQKFKGYRNLQQQTKKTSYARL